MLTTTPSSDVEGWRPHEGPQEYALRQPASVKEILYGGARGGGKTDAGMIWVGNRLWMDKDGIWRPALEHPKYRALVVRKNAEDLSDWLERFKFMYRGVDIKVTQKPPVIRFPSGALIRYGHLKDDDAYTKYQGHEYQSMLIEELTQIPSELRYMKLTSSCRTTVPEIRAQIFNTANPGGRGHMWVKNRFVDMGLRNKVYVDSGGSTRIFIPSSIDDNPTLKRNDPDYVKYLESIKDVDPDLYKAWRQGSWDVIAGQVFREFSYDRHVSGQFEFSLDVCEKIITFDWGYRDKAAAHWLALTPENKFGVRRVYVYREIVRTETDPEQWARIIKSYTDIEPVKYMVLPHDCFAHKLSKTTIAATFSSIAGINIKRGETLASGARLNRKAMLHLFLSNAQDRRPYLVVHPNCKDFITTTPLLQYDDHNVEDVDTTGDDHSYDSVTLGLITLGYRPKNDYTTPPNLRAIQTRPTWTNSPQGQIVAPNFWKEFERRQDMPSVDSEYM